MGIVRVILFLSPWTTLKLWTQSKIYLIYYLYLGCIYNGMNRPVWYRRKRSSILFKMLNPATFLYSVNLIYYETICIHFNCICIPFLILLDRFLMLTLISHAYIQRLMVPAAGIIFPQNIICPIVYDWFYPPFNSGHHAKLVCDIYMIMK